jgi:hypothetical protein
MAHGALDGSELYVAGTGTIFAKPWTSGMALPDDPDELENPGSGWVNLGYTTEDGVTFTYDRQVDDIMAWQSRRPVRKIVTSAAESVGFVLQQWNSETLPFAFGGGQVTGLGGAQAKFDLADAEDVVHFAVAIRLLDGSSEMGIVFPKGMVTDTIESVFNRASEAQLPVTFSSVDTAPYFLFDYSAFDVNS